MKWSLEQQQAIYSRNQNLLVAAAAGSGKTAVLVERIIKRLLSDNEKLDITELLVVTFTKAAAAEMRGRIGQALTEALEKGHDRRHIERQLALLNSASISTLHSFCQTVVRQHFYRLDLDPAFRLAGEAEIGMIKADAMEELFSQKYETGDESFYRLIDYYGGERDNLDFISLILKLYDFSQSHPWPREWLRGLATPFAAAAKQTVDETPWGALIMEELCFELEELLTVYDSMIQEVTKQGQPQAYQGLLVSEQAMVESALRACAEGWRQLGNVLNGWQFDRLPSVKKADASDETKEFYKKGRQKAKDFAAKTAELFFSRPPEEMLQDVAAMAPVISDLADFTLDFQEAFQQAKKAKNLLDFNDLEHFCLAILRDPESTAQNIIPSVAALAYRERFAEVMVDEYQDTNGVQEMILRLVSRDNNRFMVGDVKQSIYRFRLAEPALFMAKYNTYPAGEESVSRRIDLSQNFRSEAGILQGVNFLFRQLMTAGAAEMDYGDKEQLNPGLDYPVSSNGVIGPIEVLLVDRDDDGEKGFEQAPDREDSEQPDDSHQEGNQAAPALAEAELSSFEQESLVIAERILELKEQNSQVYDKKKDDWRPLEWRDIVILLRAPSGKAAILLDTLRQFGIPAYAEEDSGYFQATEVQIMRSLLTVIDNPCQDIPLAAVLRSPLVGLKAAELAIVRLSGDGDLRQALARYGKEETDDKLVTTVTAFLENLEQWRNFARRRGVAELISKLYRDTGYYDYVGSMPGGTVRQANLRALYDRARLFETTNFRGLFRFLRFLDRLTGDGGDMAVARALGEGEDVVRIMSIHKSKGLEFPVVFVADLGKQFNLRDTTDPVLLHKELGIGAYRYQPERRFSFPTLAWHGIRHRLMMESKAEELRVLYVAFTRAREKLILIGSAAKLADKGARWSRHVSRSAAPLPDYLIATAKTGLDWLVPALMRHRDGEVLRACGGCEDELSLAALQDIPCRWAVKIIKAGEVILERMAADSHHRWMHFVEKLEPVPAEPTPSWMVAALTWQYPCQAAVSKPAKLSVSEIKRRFAEEGEEDSQPPWKQVSDILRPRFLRVHSSTLTAAERGTIMHTVMQQLDVQGDLTAAGIAAQVQGLVERELLLPEEAAVVDSRAIAGFFDSPLGQRMVESQWIKREMAFSLLVPAERFYPDMASTGEKIFVQGVVDCVFAAGDGLVLIDYKTDSIADSSELAAKYGVQMKLYTEAVEAVSGLKVTEVYLCSFYTGQVIPL